MFIFIIIFDSQEMYNCNLIQMDNNDKLSIKNWAVDDRPRERLMLNGPESLSNAELLAILIHSGTSEKSAVDLMREIMRSCGDNLKSLGDYTVQQLCSFKGIGEAKAVTIKAALELGRRRLDEFRSSARISITSSRDVFNIMYPVMVDLDHEEFWCIMMNNANVVTDRILISSGGMTETTVDVRMIMRRALICRACAIIISHNHPSGNITPSIQDRKLTERIKRASELLGIKLLDHLIVTSSTYYSFADEGCL